MITEEQRARFRKEKEEEQRSFRRWSSAQSFMRAAYESALARGVDFDATSEAIHAVVLADRLMDALGLQTKAAPAGRAYVFHWPAPTESDGAAMRILNKAARPKKKARKK